MWHHLSQYNPNQLVVTEGKGLWNLLTFCGGEILLL